MDRHNVNLLVGRRCEVHCLTTKSLHSDSVKLPQNTHNSSFFSGAAGTEKHQMREILLFTKSLQVVRLLDMVVEL